MVRAARATALALAPALALAGCGPMEGGFELALDGQGLAPPGTTEFQIAFLVNGVPEDCSSDLFTGPRCLRSFLTQSARSTALIVGVTTA